jgi:hypothetical protein
MKILTKIWKILLNYILQIQTRMTFAKQLSELTPVSNFAKTNLVAWELKHADGRLCNFLQKQFQTTFTEPFWLSSIYDKFTDI